MKLSGRDAARFLARPDPGIAGILLYGADAMRVALKRKALVEALVGPKAADEMRLTRLAGADLRRDPAALVDAVKAVGFFPGPRAVLVEDAGEPALAAVKAALEDWAAGDAAIVATAGNLGAGSGLRKAFEAAKTAAAIGVYADPPDRAEVEAALAAAGLAGAGREVTGEIELLARALDPGDFAQFLEKLALYKHGDAGPLVSDDVAAVAPPSGEAEIDEVLMLAADGDARGLARAFRDLGGGSATSVTIAAARYFRTLHAAAAAGDPEAALSRARPPVFGPRRSRMAGQARAFGRERLETALGLVMEAELALRSSRPVPASALVERLLIRIAMLRRG
ncbi:MAG: DNA polymerase III subunit delta [Amaricoccus sp.]|uniref:DNA polymerase III subunit delta n=1 Tax=Amaricoccus sp. TaxID=1872485 RepID=UPI0039E6FD21